MGVDPIIRQCRWSCDASLSRMTTVVVMTTLSSVAAAASVPATDARCDVALRLIVISTSSAVHIIMTVLWLRLRRPCNFMQQRAISCSHLRLRLWCNCDVTATRNIHVHFSARLHDVAANHDAGIGVVDPLWRHCLLLFYVFRLINKGNLSFAVVFFY